MSAGHEVCLWHEDDRGAHRDRPQISSLSAILSWNPPERAVPEAIASLVQWRPDIVFVHSRLDPKVEQQLLDVCPAVFFAHDYVGMCISGAKTLHDPDPHPCGRTLGSLCLAHYYPHRCGGLDPRTMFRDYFGNKEQLKRLRRYRVVASDSSYLRDEYIRHGLDAERLKVVPLLVSSGALRISTRRDSHGNSPVALGFAGRLEAQKGVDVLLDSLEHVASSLGRRVTLTIAGDGRLRESLRRKAAAIMVPKKIDVRFVGWLDDAALESFYQSLDAIVIPSVWPEPFGTVGIEAAARGIPAAAFDVGGLSDWLTDGKNGHFADGTSPNSIGLASAIVSCVADADHHYRLSEGALAVAASFSEENHLRALMDVLDCVGAGSSLRQTDSLVASGS